MAKNLTSKIKLDAHNPRRHPERNRQMIRRSLDELGAGRSILLDGSNRVIAGNGVYTEAQAKGLALRIVDSEPSELIAVRRRDLKGKRSRRMALLDNRTAETAEWDPDILGSLAAADSTLLDGLFDAAELTQLIGQAHAVGEGANEKSIELTESFQIVVECKDEQDQQRVFKRMVAEGYKCRVLTL